LTDCKHIGFYLCSSTVIKIKLDARKAQLAPDEAKALQESFKKNEYFSFPNIGYDNYFYMKSRNTNIVDDDYEFVDTDTTHKMAKVFSDAQLNKKRNRALLAHFAKEIAE
jgi:hypothetical protein